MIAEFRRRKSFAAPKCRPNAASHAASAAHDDRVITLAQQELFQLRLRTKKKFLDRKQIGARSVRRRIRDRNAAEPDAFSRTNSAERTATFKRG